MTEGIEGEEDKQGKGRRHTELSFSIFHFKKRERSLSALIITPASHNRGAAPRRDTSHSLCRPYRADKIFRTHTHTQISPRHVTFTVNV